jgi:hypothetical protein
MVVDDGDPDRFTPASGMLFDLAHKAIMARWRNEQPAQDFSPLEEPADKKRGASVTTSRNRTTPQPSVYLPCPGSSAGPAADLDCAPEDPLETLDGRSR